MDHVNDELRGIMDGLRYLKIMTVDDDQVVSQLMREQLSRLGYQVVGHAVNGHQALQGVEEWEPDLIIMDAQMPNPETGEIDPMAGLEAATRIQEMRPTPIILATAHESTAMIEDASAAGVSAYLVKPVQQGELVRAIAVAMARFTDLKRLRQMNLEVQRINDKLVRSEEQFRTLAEHTPDVLWRYDRNLCQTYISPNVERLVGRPHRSLLGKRFKSLGGVSEELGDLWEGQIREVFETGKFRAYELDFTILDPPPVLEVRLVPELNVFDEVETVLCVSRDITEIRRTEAALLQSQQRAAVGTMAAGIAHQFNNLNAILLGNIDLMLADSSMGERQQKRLQTMRQTVVKETETIKQLLAVTDEFIHNSQPIQVIDLLREVVNREKSAIQNDQIDLQFDCAQTSPIKGDLDQLVQVFQQLISNARHAMLDQPSKKLTIACDEYDDQVQIQVIDNGCGIKEEHLQSIFLPFFTRKGEHADPNSPQVQVRGTGLGLSIAQSIVECQGGTLTVESTVGKGSTFALNLPAYREDGTVADLPEEETVSESTIDQPSILIVDDEPMICEMLTDILESGGYQSIAVGDGTTALEYLRETPFALVILDLNLPDMNGREFLHRLNGMHQSYRPRVILSTGDSSSTALDDIKRLGVSALLDKPYTFAQTLELIESVLAASPQEHRDD